MSTDKGVDIITPSFSAEFKGKLKCIGKNSYEGYRCTEKQYGGYPSVFPNLPIFWMFCHYELEKQFAKILERMLSQFH